MGIEVVQDHMEFLVRVVGNNAIHEVQEFPATATRIVASSHHACCHLQGRKQRCRAVSLVLVAESSQSLPIGQPKPSLSPFQCLNSRLLIHREHDTIVRWVQVEAHDVGSLLSKLRIGADAPAAAPLQVDTVLSKYTPDLMWRYI